MKVKINKEDGWSTSYGCDSTNDKTRKEIRKDCPSTCKLWDESLFFKMNDSSFLTEINKIKSLKDSELCEKKLVPFIKVIKEAKYKDLEGDIGPKNKIYTLNYGTVFEEIEERTTFPKFEYADNKKWVQLDNNGKKMLDECGNPFGWWFYYNTYYKGHWVIVAPGSGAEVYHIRSDEKNHPALKNYIQMDIFGGLPPSPEFEIIHNKSE